MELVDDGSVVLLSNLSTGQLPDEADCPVSWAVPKHWHDGFELGAQEASELGDRADGVIALVDRNCLQPRKVKAAGCDLGWDSWIGYFTGHGGCAAPPSCQVMADVAADHSPKCLGSDHGTVYEVALSTESVQLRPDRDGDNGLPAMLKAVATGSVSFYRPGRLQSFSKERTLQTAI